MEKPIRFGVLGAEHRGLLSLHAHRPEQGFFVSAVCSLSTDGLGIYRDRCGADVFLTDDYREILRRPEIDAVFICVPDFLHEEYAVASLQAGKHVYLEKPMAITIEGCDRILTEARRSGKTLYVGHNMRFFPVLQKMKELIDNGAIGRVQAVWCRHFISYGGDAYFRDWHSERRFTHGLLLQKGAHDIDVIHWLGGAHTRRVVGMGRLSVYDKLPRRKSGEPQSSVSFNPSNWPPSETSGYSSLIDVEDHSMILMELDNGVQASYQQCHYTPDSHRNYTVIGDAGRIENYGDYSTPERWATVHLWNSRRTIYSEMGHEVFRISDAQDHGEHGGADPLIVDDFLNVLRGREPKGASPIDARMAVAAGYLGTESLRMGGLPQEVPDLPGPTGIMPVVKAHESE